MHPKHEQSENHLDTITQRFMAVSCILKRVLEDCAPCHKLKPDAVKIIVLTDLSLMDFEWLNEEERKTINQFLEEARKRRYEHRKKTEQI